MLLCIRNLLEKAIIKVIIKKHGASEMPTSQLQREIEMLNQYSEKLSHRGFQGRPGQFSFSPERKTPKSQQKKPMRKKTQQIQRKSVLGLIT